MTTEDHVRRVRRMARDAAAWEDQPDPYSDAHMAAIRRQLESGTGPVSLGALREAINADHSESLVCSCPTCGVVNARVRGALTARGWAHSATHHVHVAGNDFRGGADPGYLAVVKVEGEEIHRAYADLAELLEPDVIGRIEDALRRRLC